MTVSEIAEANNVSTQGLKESVNASHPDQRSRDAAAGWNRSLKTGSEDSVNSPVQGDDYAQSITSKEDRSVSPFSIKREETSSNPSTAGAAPSSTTMLKPSMPEKPADVLKPAMLTASPNSKTDASTASVTASMPLKSHTEATAPVLRPSLPVIPFSNAAEPSENASTSSSNSAPRGRGTGRPMVRGRGSGIGPAIRPVHQRQTGLSTRTESPGSSDVSPGPRVVVPPPKRYQKLRTDCSTPAKAGSERTTPPPRRGRGRGRGAPRGRGTTCHTIVLSI